MNPTTEISYFVNWDDYGDAHVPYRIWVERGTHVLEFWKDGAWIRDESVYRAYVHGFDPTVQRVTREKVEEVIAKREAIAGARNP